MTSYENSPEPEYVQAPAAFIIVEGSQILSLEGPITTIGRRADNHIVVKHEYVSRYHAEVRMIPGGYELVDLDSTVGTSVNGKRIDRVALQPGDVISVGGAPLIFGVGIPKAKFDSPEPGVEQIQDTRPTGQVDIRDADQYLDFFETPNDKE